MGREVWGSVRAGGASRRSPGRRARARVSRPCARRRPGRRRERWRARRRGRATTRPRRRRSGGRGACPWAGGPMRWRRRQSGCSRRFGKGASTSRCHDVPEQGGARVEREALERGGSPLVRVLRETKSSRVGWSTTPRRRIWSGPGGPQPTYVRTKGSKASLSFIKSKLVLSYFLLLCTLANVELPFFCKELIYFL